jgi:hypothetical protein
MKYITRLLIFKGKNADTIIEPRMKKIIGVSFLVFGDSMTIYKHVILKHQNMRGSDFILHL